MKTQTIYNLISDNGDGSSSIHWFRDVESAMELIEDDQYAVNEGMPGELTFPEDLDLEECGFDFSD